MTVRIRLEDLVVPEAEEPFRLLVRSMARMLGWELTYHTHNSRRSDAGWPDEVYGHPAQRRTLFVELKSNRGRVSRDQRRWLCHLADSGCEAALWRPRDIAEVLAVLQGQRATLSAEVRNVAGARGDRLSAGADEPRRRRHRVSGRR